MRSGTSWIFLILCENHKYRGNSGIFFSSSLQTNIFLHLISPPQKKSFRARKRAFCDDNASLKTKNLFCCLLELGFSCHCLLFFLPFSFTYRHKHKMCLAKKKIAKFIENGFSIRMRWKLCFVIWKTSEIGW